ncbi:PoNe immunity protein domain-containing protein [Ralstonia pseudosolanacearum]|uniref:PoNe immunity protein domain-containing protein n=1 Tax=Ralstonia pseudosolanacearum TaxID=1310165 RepID=UPI000E5806C8|nr:PoNe immunity protein domain-containing protein [Ralstonia pseudosolanacearum]
MAGSARPLWMSQAMAVVRAGGSYLDLSEERGLHFGHLAIEAAALAHLLGLDDTSLREHIV